MISRVVLRTQPDARLATLAAQGSEPAFEALVQRYRRLLHAYCRRLLLSDNRSEDVVQQAFFNAWTALNAGAEVRDVKPWLFRITHNQAISALRRPGYDFDELSESLCGTTAPDADLERRALMRETLGAVAALPDLQREAILRTAVDGSSYEEVAAALGITGKAVRGLVYRARISLRQSLAAFAPGPVVLWAAGGARRTGLVGWLGEAMAGGGSAGGAAIVLKSAGVLATSAVVVGGTVGGAIRATGLVAPVAHHAARHITATPQSVPKRAVASSAHSSSTRPAASRTAQPYAGGSRAARSWAVSARPVVAAIASPVPSSSSATSGSGSHSSHAARSGGEPGMTTKRSGSSSRAQATQGESSYLPRSEPPAASPGHSLAPAGGGGSAAGGGGSAAGGGGSAAGGGGSAAGGASSEPDGAGAGP